MKGFEFVKKNDDDMTCDFMPTCGGRGQRHLHGLVGRIFKINNPDTVRVGNCFLAGRLNAGDLFLCTGHRGDCFQSYIYAEIRTNYDETSVEIKPMPQWEFGSYGIGDSLEMSGVIFDVKEIKRAMGGESIVIR